MGPGLNTGGCGPKSSTDGGTELRTEGIIPRILI